MEPNLLSDPRMNKQLQVLLAIILTAPLACAQLVSFGAKAGVPFIEDLPGHDESRPYIIGPSVEFRLPAGFAAEADALYRRIGSSTAFLSSINTIPPTFPALTSFSERLRGNEWEVSLVGKYYFHRRSRWQPYVGTGYAFRTIGTRQDISQTLIDANGDAHNDSFHVHSRSDLGVGAVAAAGVRFRAGHFSLLPEIRYTRWGSQNNIFQGKNEAAFLLGLSF